MRTGLMILQLAALAWASGALYHLGGIGAPYNTKHRDIGCVLCVLIGLLVLSYFHWSMLLSGVFLFGALTTYWKGDKPDVLWYHWLFTGAGYSVALLPVSYFTGSMQGWMWYALIVTIGTCLWSVLVRDVRWEETGRGALLILPLPLLRI